MIQDNEQGEGAQQADGLSPTVEPLRVSPVPASIPSAVKGAFRESLGFIWRDFDERMAKDFIEALHSRGFAVVEMNTAPQVWITTQQADSYFRDVRVRATIEAGVLGAQHRFPEDYFNDFDFRLDHLPRLLARSIANVIEDSLVPRIAQGMEARRAVPNGAVNDSPVPEGNAPKPIHSGEQ